MKLVKRNIYGLLAALLTAVGLALIYTVGGSMPGGDYIFMQSDLRVLYASFGKLFWSSLLSGKGIDYTFYVSLGTPGIPLYTTYCLSPFNLLYVLIGNAELASVILVFLKLSLAAFMFQRFLRNSFRENGWSTVAFAVAYAMNAYCIIFYFNITFLDGVYMLPLIIELVLRFVKEQKGAKLVLAYAYLFVVQFYEGYIIGFFSLLIFVLAMVYVYGRKWKSYVTASLRFISVVVCAALMGAVFLLPTGIYLMNNRDETPVSWELTANLSDIYGNLFLGRYQDLSSPYPYLYCGILVLFLIPLFFSNKKIERRIKVLAVVPILYLLICSLWIPGYQFMHCFDKPDGFGFRFAYFFPFVFLTLAFYQWKKIEQVHLWSIICLALINMIYYAWVCMSGTSETIFNLLFLIIWSVLLVIRGKGKNVSWINVALAVVLWIELVINGSMTNVQTNRSMWEQREVYQAFQQVNQQAVDEIKAEDNGVYRVRQLNPYDYNDCAWNEYMGMTYFSSVMNKTLRSTLSHMGYYTSMRLGSDSGGSDVTRMLLGEKYTLDVNNMDGEEASPWYRHEETLSLVYMVSEKVLDVSLESDNAFENQNQLISGMTGQPMNVFLPYDGEIEVSKENLTVYWDGEGFGIEPAEGAQEGYLKFQLMKEAPLPVYGYFSQEEALYDQKSFYISTYDQQFRVAFPMRLSSSEIIKLHRDSEGKYAIVISFDEEHKMNNFYKQDYFYCYDAAIASRVYEQLKDHQMDITKMNGDDISASIDVEEDKTILFTSIPYDPGWHIIVDGEEIQPIAVVDSTFLAAQLTPGHHELHFYYQDPVVIAGGWISVTTLSLYLLVCICIRLRKGTLKVENICKEKKYAESH